MQLSIAAIRRFVATFCLTCLISILSARASMITVYVECPGMIAGVPTGVGHAFVQLTPQNNAQVGQNLFYGLYPKTADVFTDGGIIKNDVQRPWNYQITYNVTPAQYNMAVTAITNAINTPPNYNLTGNNCVAFANQVASAAGITLPNFNRTVGRAPLTTQIPDPAALCTSLMNLGNGGMFMGGTVAKNLTPGAGDFPTLPRDYAYLGLEQDGHAEPATVASYTSLSSDIENLGDETANLTTGITVNATDADLDNSLVSVNWGDGSAFDDQSDTFSHVYSSPGTYDADLLVIDSGTVHDYDMTVNVNGGAGSVVNVIVPPPTPSTVVTTGTTPAVVIPLPDNLPEPASLALVGGFVVMLLRRR